MSPTNIVGTHTPLQGGELTITGPPDHLWVNDALVPCGGITTANATLYLVALTAVGGQRRQPQ